jgi:4a-hydroxytetrahydrobiopterin dehydratase
MSTPLTDHEITDALASLPGWRAEANHLCRDFTFGGFKEALSFIVRVGLHAECMDHHPELTNVYNTVSIRLNTHAAGGRITRKDVDLAAQINQFDWTK